MKKAKSKTHCFTVKLITQLATNLNCIKVKDTQLLSQILYSSRKDLSHITGRKHKKVNALSTADRQKSIINKYN